MDLSYLNPHNDSNTQMLQSPNSIKIDEFGGIYVETKIDEEHIEPMKMDVFLWLTQYEKNVVEQRRKQWFVLLWEKTIGWDYPDYFKKFHFDNIHLFSGSEELTEYRDVKQTDDENQMFPNNRENKELIFVKLSFPQNISPEVKKETLGFREVFDEILWNIWLTK